MNFDRGIEAEAKTLAVHVRLLLHATNQSKALVDQLGLRSTLKMYDTASPFDEGGSVVGQSALTTLGMQLGRYAPLLDTNMDQGFGFVSVGEWWERPVIMDSSGYTLTRESLVLVMANQEGAHVDPELNDVYANLVDRGLGLQALATGKPATPVYAAVRQVAHEVLVSLAHSSAPFPETVSRRRYRYLPGPSLDDVYGSGGFISGLKVYGENPDGSDYVHGPNAGWPDRIGRNQPCPCGSGKKFKYCHGC